MITFSNAKINLGLYVTGKRSDGYHNIESLFLPIRLYDAIELLPEKENKLSLYGFPIPGEVSQNSCLKALSLMKREFGIQNYHIHLFKQIPTGAGLGGGSSNASFVIRLVNQMEELNLSNAEMENLAIQIGSDNPFFIENKAKFVSGRGEHLTDCSINLRGYKLVLIYPDVHMGTASAYQLVKYSQPNLDLQNLCLKQFLEHTTEVYNAFQTPFFDLFPNTQEILAKMNEAGAIYSSLSGSGSTFYSIYHPNQTIQPSLKEYAKTKQYLYFETNFL